MLRMILSDPVNYLYLLFVVVLLAEALWVRGGRPGRGVDARPGKPSRLTRRARAPSPPEARARWARRAPGRRSA